LNIVAAGRVLFFGLSALDVFPNADVFILTSKDREVIGLLTALETDVLSPEHHLGDYRDNVV
jgi:hypothetical protein